MSDAPWQIWATNTRWDNTWRYGSYCVSREDRYPVAYIRADFYTTLQARLAEVEAERDEWQSLAEAAIKDDAMKNVHYAEVQTRVKGLEEALRAFSPNRIGHGPSTDMRKLHDAQMAAEATLEDMEKVDE
jgi:hypothetical protein